jgi:LPXTG-site transpeptidase (sortase) family protein
MITGVKRAIATGVMAISIAILLYPYVPQASFYLSRFAQHDPVSFSQTDPVQISSAPLPSEEQMERDPSTSGHPTNGFVIPEAIIPESAQLIIPALDLEADVIEGESLSVINGTVGVWRDPYSRTPNQGGNVVIAGHRWGYPSNNLFYHMDKLKAGDEIHLQWGDTRYSYRVRESFEVTPKDTYIMKNTPGIDELTLYTCTPIGSTRFRLVVKADRIAVH